MDILTRLGVARRINVAGTLTRLGGSLMEPEVLQAMAQAASASVDIAEMQSAASQVIARATGAQAGIVTSGAAAGLTLWLAHAMALPMGVLALGALALALAVRALAWR